MTSGRNTDTQTTSESHSEGAARCNRCNQVKMQTHKLETQEMDQPCTQKLSASDHKDGGPAVGSVRKAKLRQHKGCAELSNARSRLGYKQISAVWTAILLQNEEDVTQPVPETQTLDTGTDVDFRLPSAMYDQGDHEVEVTGDGYEAAVRWTKCLKNVGHQDFIKVQDFTLEHLPVSLRDDHIFRYINLWSQLVVKITVNQISSTRPEGYAFHSLRGQNIPITGSGKVADITTVKDTPCPCLECCQSDNPKMVWKAVWVMTAMHVVYSDSEAMLTDIELFYDNPDNKYGIRKMRGTRVVDCNVWGDWCKFECATHDLEFGQQLEQIDEQVLQLGQMIKDKHEAENLSPLAVIASHPHGSSKHITIGEWKDRKLVKNKEENYEWTEYLYTTSTCTGCSGAPVWIIGPQRIHYSYNYYSHVHSEGLKSGLNKSGAGDVEKRWDNH